MIKSRIFIFKELEIEHIQNRKLKHSYIQIKNQKVIVKTPAVDDSFVDALLEKKSSWIFATLQKLEKKVEYNYFKEVYYLGTLHQIHKDNKFHLLDKSIESLKNPQNIISLHDKFYKIEAMDFLQKRLDYYAEVMQLSYAALKVRKMKRRWGSCTSHGVITFNIYLMKHSLDVIDYVVVHELAHLKQMNHSKKFYAIVKQYMPNYKEIEAKMKSLALIL